jgi:hypothetical protein
MTHTQNKIIDAANPELLPDYQKSEGMQINQAYSYVSRGMYNTWDQLYGSAAQNANDNQKLPGNYYLVDYNGDGLSILVITSLMDIQVGQLIPTMPLLVLTGKAFRLLFNSMLSIT